ncbi:MAG: PEP-CTERM sorting domain-containing protein [Planctomycetes bacterium]|nr:PEP-CTERM sorting domain-containing protein [Planctomycetota bacterium]
MTKSYFVSTFLARVDDPNGVPEPATLALAALAGLMLFASALRRRSTAAARPVPPRSVAAGWSACGVSVTGRMLGALLEKGIAMILARMGSF